MPVNRGEIFGPALRLIPYQDEDVHIAFLEPRSIGLLAWIVAVAALMSKHLLD